MDLNSMEPTGVIGTIVSSLVAVGLYLRSLKPKFAKDDLVAKQAEADMGIIGRLEKECQRLSEQNDMLAKNLNQFQLEIGRLVTENQKFSLENNALREENLSLREEIMELRREVQELSASMLDVQRMRNAACLNCENR